MVKPENELQYYVRLTYDGMVRKYWCETQYDTVILFDALYRGAQWQDLAVIDCRTFETVQSITR